MLFGKSKATPLNSTTLSWKLPEANDMLYTSLIPMKINTKMNLPSFLFRLSSWILFSLCSSNLKFTFFLRGWDWGWLVWGSNSPSLEVSESSRDLVWPRFTVSRYLVNKSVSHSEKSATTWSSLIRLRLLDCRTLVKWPLFRGRDEFAVEVKTWVWPSIPSCWPFCCWPWPKRIG